MPKRSPDPAPDSGRYELYDRLDQYEELLEDMLALDVRSIDDVQTKIEELNLLIDSGEDPGPDEDDELP